MHKRTPSECFRAFKHSINSILLPERFTFPFHYTPHPLCKLAAEELQEHLQTQTDWDHDFGTGNEPEPDGNGKMFGVLIVKNKLGVIGYLSAFSGRLANSNRQPGFVPPIYDLDDMNGSFRIGEAELNKINHLIENIENSASFIKAKEELEFIQKNSQYKLLTEKQKMKQAKLYRKELRNQAKKALPPEMFDSFIAQLENESRKQKYDYRQLVNHWEKQLTQAELELSQYTDEIQQLKTLRKNKSARLQKELFDQYRLLNIKGEIRSVSDIFAKLTQKTPPAATGECAAPKLLQYAFQQQMTPLAMAEFWWGKPPKSEIRKHKHFYPACRSKCEPILGHMLNGLKLDNAPQTSIYSPHEEIEIIFEDEAVAVINKPSGMLSVPGKQNAESVFSKMKARYPHASGPIIVHRLDMATSGLMVIAKHKEAHAIIQKQFLSKSVKKRYVALVDGLIAENAGTIELPLRVDLDNRPQQLVCFQDGKFAKTIWKVIERQNGQTRIHFIPVTGRTHQLRIHSAHPQGLNTPIVGDELYGTPNTRLHLHAEYLEFRHPATGKKVRFATKADF